jgi:hypothetical protein
VPAVADDASKGSSGAASKPKGDQPEEDRRKGPQWDRRRLRLAVVGLAVVVALIAWLATRGGGSDSSEPEPTAAAGPPRIVTVSQLREVAATLGQPIYWAGPIAGKELELKELGEGGVQVLYLPEGTEAGKGSPKSLTIGSYPLGDPEKALEGFAERPGSSSRQASDGREVVVSKTAPTSVYFTSPDNSVQVEVYDPSAQKAMNLAVSGKVEPAG